MTALRFHVSPRDVPAICAARRLGLTLAQFEEIKDRLFSRGFPKPDLETGRFGLQAIEHWMDVRSGLIVEAPAPIARLLAPEPRIPQWLRILASDAKKRAAKKKVTFALSDVDLESLSKKANGRCQISGIKFRFDFQETRKRRPFAPSLDRIIPAEGYVPGNVRLVCSIVNIAMNEWGEEPLHALVAAMARRRDQ